MARKLVFTLLFIYILVLPTRVSADNGYTARSYNVNIDIQPGGALQVSETAIFRMTGGPLTAISRTIETNYSDSVTDIHAYLDGQELPRGADPGHVQIETGNPLRITWHFLGLSDSTHTFALQYTVLGAVRIDHGHDLLLWNALPPSHDYPIESSRVQVSYPPSAALAGQPSVALGSADIRSGPNEVTFQATNIAANQPLRISLPFQKGSLISTPPDWQRRELLTTDITNQIMPYIVVAGFAILFLGVLGFVYWRKQANLGRHSRPSVDKREPVPPDDLPPGMASALVSRDDQVSWTSALGTLFDLAAQGWVQIEELQGRRLFVHSFAIHFTGDANRLASRTDNLHPHERALLRMLFETREGRREQLSLPELRRTVSRNFLVYSEAVKQELLMNGLVSPERRANRSRMILVGVVLLFLGLFGGLLSLVFSNVAATRDALTAYRWLLMWFSSSVALFFVGIIGVMIGSVFSPLTILGEQAGEHWRAFKRYLRAVARGREPLGENAPELFDAYLPYAASFGLGESWANFFRKKKLAPPPAWFRPLAGTSNGKKMAAFVTTIAAAGSIGTTTGGGARVARALGADGADGMTPSE